MTNRYTVKRRSMLALQVVRHSKIQELMNYGDISARVSIVIARIEHSYLVSGIQAESMVEMLDALDRERKSFAKAACPTRGETRTRRVGAVQPQKRSEHYA